MKKTFGERNGLRDFVLGCSLPNDEIFVGRKGNVERLFGFPVCPYPK
jgi:hypothetical protein